jgi:hypothetical protein
MRRLALEGQKQKRVIISEKALSRKSQKAWSAASALRSLRSKGRETQL